jgi:hypothetical protein
MLLLKEPAGIVKAVELSCRDVNRPAGSGVVFGKDFQRLGYLLGGKCRPRARIGKFKVVWQYRPGGFLNNFGGKGRKFFILLSGPERRPKHFMRSDFSVGLAHKHRQLDMGQYLI